MDRYFGAVVVLATLYLAPSGAAAQRAFPPTGAPDSPGALQWARQHPAVGCWRVRSETVHSADRVAERFLDPLVEFGLDTASLWQRGTGVQLRLRPSVGIRNPSARPLHALWQHLHGRDSALVRWHESFEGIEFRVRIRGQALEGSLYSLTDYDAPQLVRRARGERIGCERLDPRGRSR